MIIKKKIKKNLYTACLIIVMTLVFTSCNSSKQTLEAVDATNAPTQTQEADDELDLTLETNDESDKTQETDADTTKETEEPKTIAATGSVEEPEAVHFSVSYTPVFSEDFESGKCLFSTRGAATVKIVEEAYEGVNCLLVTNRLETWNGPIMDVKDMMEIGERYRVEAWVWQAGSTKPLKISAMLQQNGSNYLSFGSTAVKSGEWSKIDGIITLPPGTTSAGLYFETSYKSNPEAEDLVDFCVDNIVISKVTTQGSAVDLPSLYEIHKDYFSIGIGIGPYEIATSERAAVIKRHFNSITMGNEMKPDYILDYAVSSSDPEKYNLEPAIHTKNMDIGLKFALENDIKLRGHTLVWHSQTPIWFFKEGYKNDADAPNVSREVMLARMESYIKQVLTYCKENYPGVVYSFDVVNEAIDRADGDPNGIRVKDNPWYEVVGADYVEMAFTYARKYAEPSTKLFYNDYNCWYRDRVLAIFTMAEGFIEKGIIDGIGLQGHIGISDPSIVDYQYAVGKYGSLPLEVQITELDVGLNSNSDEDLEKLGSRYKRFMTMLRYMKESGQANITNVTVWGLTDDSSWLNDDTGTKYPLLFDMYLHPKAAFYGFGMFDSVSAFQKR